MLIDLENDEALVLFELVSSREEEIVATLRFGLRQLNETLYGRWKARWSLC